MLLRLIRNFLGRENGNVALIVTIAMLPMVLSAGASIDFVRAHMAKTSLQQAVDAAGLAGGSNPDATDEDLLELAQDFLEANADGLVLDIANSSVTTSEVDGIRQVDITATADLETTFLRLFNIRSLDVAIDTRVQRREAGPVQIALVLDTTASMSALPSTGGTLTKIQSLRAAANGLVNDLMTAANPHLQVGVVPYAGNIRLYTVAETQASGFTPPAWIKPQTMATSCSVDMVRVTPCNTPMCTRDGIYRAANDCCGYTCPSGQPGTSLWEGCVGPRTLTDTGQYTTAFLRTIANPTSPPYPGVPRHNWNCASQKILSLTNSKSSVTSRINALSPGGDTFIPAGLTWGWNVLASADLYGAESVPLVQARGGKKVLVLMTDGINALRINTTHGRLEGTTNPSTGNTLTSQLCTDIKTAGIEIFTVLFDVQDPTTRDMLRNCASSPSMAFNASDAAGLSAAFGSIGDQLRSVKITQ